MLWQILPALEVLFVEFRRFESKFRRAANETSFKHEGQRIRKIDRLQFRGSRFFEGLTIRAVSSHAVVQAGSARDETFRFSIVLSANQAHKFIHEIAVEPWRTEGVLGDHPARRENHKIKVRSSRN